MTRPRELRGMTLIELLVVIAIIAVLIGMLIPCILEAQEAASRAQCGANLQQLAIAMHDHVDAYGAFPNEEHVSYFEPALDETITWQGSFYVHLLPFMDSTIEASVQDIQVTVLVPRRHRVTVGRILVASDARFVKTFTCVSRRDERVGAKDDFASATGIGILRGRAAGVQPADIWDGTANTLLLSHKGMLTDKYYSSNEPDDLGWADTRVSSDHLRSGVPCQDTEDFADGFGSPHRKVIPSVFADGHVSLLRYDAFLGAQGATCWTNLWHFKDGAPVSAE